MLDIKNENKDKVLEHVSETLFHKYKYEIRENKLFFTNTN